MISFVDEEQGAGVDLVEETSTMFSDSGLLSKAKNFEFRAEQQQMAVEVAEALKRSRHLIVEAGTGVGKSLAYLIPAILHAAQPEQKSGHLHAHDQPAGAVDREGSADAQANPAGGVFVYDAEGAGNYLCTRRLQRARQQAANLLSSSEMEELKRITDWAKETTDGSLSDFDITPDPKVWDLVCSERGLCSTKLCGHNSDFSKIGQTCFYQRARSRILSADVLVLNHSLFFSFLGDDGREDDAPNEDDGVLFNNDFVILDEAHNVGHVASKHMGMSVSSGQVRFNLQRLWNPKTGKGLLGLLRSGKATRMVEDAEAAMEQFFGELEVACDELSERQAKSRTYGANKNGIVEGAARAPCRVDRRLADSAASAGARGVGAVAR